ncbi:MAG: hypothetical protein ACRDY1_09380 [Acidimicrobiales bacterium]
MNVDTLGRQNLRQVSHLHRHRLRGWATGEPSWLRSTTLAGAVVIGAATLVLRLVYGAAVATDRAGAALVAGTGHFDVRLGSPPAPGSWLYLAAGRALHDVAGLSTVHALVLVSALLSAAAAGGTCLAGTALGGRFVGLAAGAFVGTAPVAWFAGSTVSTAGVGAALAALLIVLARRARPYRAHGIVAVAALGLAAGVRLSVVPALVLVAAIAVVASVRTVGQLLLLVGAGVASVAAWLVPVAVLQSGGLRAWLHAVHLQLSHTGSASSVFVAPAARATTNLGTAAAWSLVTLAPVAAVAVVGVVVLVLVRLVTRRPAGNTTLRIWAAGTEPTVTDERPWYQTTTAVLVAAIVPPVAVVTLGRFTGGGDVLDYLVPAAVLFLLPLGRLLHHHSPGVRRPALALAAVLVAATVVFNVQRFVAAPGILPARVIHHEPHLWISKARYGAPYADTAATIRAADAGRGAADRPERVDRGRGSP